MLYDVTDFGEISGNLSQCRLERVVRRLEALKGAIAEPRVSLEIMLVFSV